MLTPNDEQWQLYTALNGKTRKVFTHQGVVNKGEKIVWVVYDHADISGL